MVLKVLGGSYWKGLEGNGRNCKALFPQKIFAVKFLFTK
jgi:hypothetical protein